MIETGNNHLNYKKYQDLVDQISRLKEENEALSREAEKSRQEADSAIKECESFQKLYKTALSSISDCMYIVDDNLTVLFINDAQKKFNSNLGITNSIIGQKLEDVYRHLFDDLKRAEYDSIFKNHEEVKREEKTLINGKEIIVEIKKQPVISENNVIRVVTTISNITEKKKADVLFNHHKDELSIKDQKIEEICAELQQKHNELKDTYYKLKQKEEKYRFLANNISDVVWIADLDLQFKYISPSTEKLLGYPLNERYKLPLDKILEEESFQRIHRILNKVKDDLSANIANQLFEITLIHKDGTRIPAEIKVTLIKNQHGITSGIFGISRDIRERKESENQVRESEKNFRMLFESMHDFIAIHDFDNCFIEVNAAFCRALKYSKEEVFRMKPNQIEVKIGTDDIKSRKEQLDQKGYAIFDTIQVAKDGTKIPVEVISKIIIYKGKPALLSIGRDITERKKIEKKKKQFEEDSYQLGKAALNFLQLSTEEDILHEVGLHLQNKIRNAIIIINKFSSDGKKLIPKNIYGLEKSILGKALKILNLNPLGKEFDIRNDILQIIKDERIKLYNHEFEDFIGDIVPRKISEKLKHFLRVNFIYVIGIKRKDTIHGAIHIITLDDTIIREFSFIETLVYQASIALHRKQIENELVKEKQKAEELNKTKDKFFSIIAHDLRNPFNLLIGFSDLLNKNIQKYDTKRISKYSRIINEAARQGYNLLDNLLHWSRAQTGRLLTNFESLNLYELIDDMLYFLVNQATQKGIYLSTEIDEDVSTFVDRQMFNTVLRNFVSNAIKFTPKGGTVIIKSDQITENNKPYIKISVIDTGVGMNEDKLSKLFRLDQNVSSPGTNDEIGTGLGLLLCKEFINRMHGSITVKSKVNEGSTFEFTVPVANPNEER